MTNLPRIGDIAPDFEAPDETRSRVKLSALKGSTVVLYFYPKDDTPGCTAEACSFRDSHSEFQKKGIKVVGVSVDNEKSHTKFKEKYNLNFTLVADKEKDIARKYGVLSDRGVASRVTFVIDSHGKIAHVYDKVTPKDHSSEVMSKIEELNLA